MICILLILTLCFNLRSNADITKFVNFTIKEDPQSFTAVGAQIGKVVGYVNSANSEPQAKRQYIVVDGDPLNYFTVGRYSGEIRTSKPLDYEVQSNFDLKIKVTGVGETEIVNVNIKVEDINDNFPLFTENSSAVIVYGNHPVGLPIYYAMANDLDQGQNGVVRYSIVDNICGNFFVDKIWGAVMLKKPAFMLNPGNYNCQIIANDLGDPPLNSSMVLLITIRSYRDSESLFLTPFLQYDIKETVPINTTLFRLNTTQVSKNDNLIFESLNALPSDLFGTFSDGQIYVKNTLDYELVHSFDLVVLGTVYSTDRLRYSSSATVYFQIFDANDNSPQCVHNVFTFYLAEESEPYSYVGTVEATDSDSGLNGLVSFRLINENHFVPFVVDSSSGVIRNLFSFDRENMDKYTGKSPIRLKVEVTDHGSPQLSTTCSVEVIITDINDNAPTFSLDFYIASVYENIEIKSEILQLSAVDMDQNENADLHYFITDGNDNGTFWLNETSGQLVIKRNLDREAVPSYQLSFLVRDWGVPSLNSTTKALVTVRDVNDNAPRFVISRDNFQISEAAGVGTLVTVLSAVDADIGLAGSVKYYLQNGNVDWSFEIDNISGALKLIKVLDYETLHNYSLLIVAADEGVPGLSSQTVITIEVLDENDNYPVINAASSVGKVPANSPIGTKVLTVSASDADSGKNGEIRFSLLKQIPSTAFSINPDTGVISLESVLNSRKASIFKLLLEAQDQAVNVSRRLSSQKFLTITIVKPDSNSNAFDGVRACVIPYPPQTDSKLASLKSNYQIISSDSDLFTISPDGGLYFKRALKTYKPIYKILIDTKDTKIKDQQLLRQPRTVQTSPDNSTIEYVIILQYDNNGDTSFDQESYTIEIPDSVSIGTEIGRVKARSSSGDKLEYYITKISSNSSDSSQLLDVDAYSGSLRVERQLDTAGPVAQFSVEIYAVNVESTQPHTARCSVTIKIISAKDSQPKFAEDFYEFQIAEDVQVGTVVGAVSVSNNDTSNRITFSLEQNQSGFFNINPQSGLITSRYLLDREQISSYVLIAKATDGVYSSAAFVKIELTDVNDNTPRFTQNGYSFRIYEGAERNSFVGAVKALDLDYGLNGIVEYKIVSSETSSEFTLDHSTGVLTVNGVLDAEKIPFYKFTVVASDKGYPSKESETMVYVEVLDVNDNQPSLNQTVFELKIKEDAAVGTSLVQLNPFDPDTETEFYYEIAAGDPWNEFRVDFTGNVTVAKPLDREIRMVHRLHILVWDASPSAPLRHFCTAELIVTLLDVNDNPPKIVSRNTAYVMENSPGQTLVSILKARDDDEGANGLVQFALNPSDTGIPDFSVDPVTGRILVKGALDREIKDSYNLSVFAYDRGEPSLKSYANLIIKILDDEDNQPHFVENFRELTVAEDLSVGQSLLQLSATDKDINENAAMKFWIDSGDVNNDFTVSPDTGLLSVAHPLNYERANGYNLTLAVTNLKTKFGGDSVSPDKATVILSVTDVNDNAPTFAKNPVYLSVAENFPQVPIIIGQARATDPDSGLNGKLSYSMTQGNTSLFSIDSLVGYIKLNGILDRETTDNYKLIVQVSDSGNPRLTGTATVIVNVLDLNDNTPKFEQNYYSATVEENQPNGTFVVTVEASDNDNGKNGEIKYFLKRDTYQSLPFPFTIDERTGIISTKGALDREYRRQWNLTVVARDQGIGIQLETSAWILVDVKDQNDNAPIVRNTKSDIFLKNPSNKGEFVYVVDAYDLDEGLNAQLKFVLSGKDAESFAVDGRTGIISSNQTPLTQDSYTINVTVSDGGTPVQQTSVSYRLYFRPPNEFPKFDTIINETLAVAEDKYDTLISTVSARSPKQAPFNRIVYSIAAGDINSAFYVDPDSGTLSTTSNLDFELVPFYTLYLSASDNDNPALTSFLKVPVQLIDVNDNVPKFTHSVYKVRVLEEEPPPVTIMKVKATDTDSGKNGEINYFLTSSNNYFEIDRKTGVLSTVVQIDREKISKFELSVTAKDLGQPSLSSYASVIIEIDDINDNAPKFTRLFSASIPEDASVGTFVTQVTSSDADSPENSNNTYYLSVNPGGKFAIDPYSGNVTVAAILDRETTAEFSLKVSAVDGAWRVETSLSISVLDVNDNAPNFTSPFYMFNVSERQSPFTVVGVVAATDRDGNGPNSKIWYKMEQKSPYFTVNAVSGELSTTKLLYFYKNNFAQNFHRFNIVAQDYGVPALRSSTVVVVRVMEANLHAPVFARQFYKFAIPLNIEANSVVGIVQASDEFDSGLNGLVSYKTLEQGDFTIDSNTGVIQTVKSLKSNSGREYSFTVIAYDHGVPSQSVEAEVTVVAANPNQNAPQFTSQSYSASLPEDAPNGTVILILTARDADDGVNGEIRYLLENFSSSLSDLFFLNETSGTLTLVGSLDYEQIKEYNFKVHAVDSGYNSKNSTSTVTVTVQDVDDNSPVFLKSDYDCRISENSPLNSFMCQMNAVDKDDPPFNSIVYSFCDEIFNNTFIIGSDSGKIFTNAPMDYESVQIYRYKVCASNKNHSITSFANLTIYIQGVNEYWPKFAQSFYELSIPDYANPGSVWPGVKASDDDIGPDGVVYYFGQNFSIDSNLINVDRLTGSIVVLKKLDAKFYSFVSFTVGAKNRHFDSEDQISFAQVFINIKSGVAPPPIFARKEYQIKVAENAVVGTTVLTVSTINDGKAVFYSMLNVSSDYNPFLIDERSGLIRINGAIDRETVDHFNLTVLASYNSDFSSNGTCFINVTVLDVNDNAPYLRPSRSFGHILEGDSVGTNITSLLPEDLDSPPNGAPFKFSLAAGNEDNFEIDQITGVIRNKKIFDREKQNLYDLRIIVSDNGNPSQSSTVKFTVYVDDVNDNPSTSQPFQLFITTYDKDLFFGSIGPVNPSDIDTVGDYQCKINAQTDNLFNVESGCLLSSAKLTTGRTYLVNMNGTDGVHDWVSYNVTVALDTVSNETLAATAIFQIQTEENYESHRVITDLTNFVGKHRRHVKIISFKPLSTENRFQLALSLYDETNNLLSSEMSVKLINSLGLENTSKMFEIIDSNFGFCFSLPCKNGGRCFDSVTVDNNREFLTDNDKLYSFANIQRLYTCECAEGFVGKNCETKIDRCALTNCQNGGSCVRNPNGKSFCSCSPGFQGALCQNDIDECSSGENPCKNGGYCENTNGSYKCICLIGYSGKDCSNSDDTCLSEPCFNGGRCQKSASPDGYKCICTFGYIGKNCEISSLGFDQVSFLELNPLSVHETRILLEFATLKQNSLLLYFYENNDYLLLDIVNGNLRLISFKRGVELFEIKLPKRVNDGKWNRLNIYLSPKFVTLSVGSCPTGESSCEECPVNDSSCSSRGNINSDVSISTILTGNLLIGGVKSFDDFLAKVSNPLSSGFLGCMRNIFINNRSIDDHGIVDKSNVSNFCPRTNESPCQMKNSCRDGETCIDKWSHRVCTCTGGFSASNCEDVHSATSFGGGFVSYQLKESYRRFMLLKHQNISDSFRTKRASRRADHWLSFEFRSTIREGLLFFSASGEEFSLLDISNDTIRYISKVANLNPMQMYLTDDIPVSDGEWHTVSLRLYDNARTVELTLDDRGKQARSPSSVHVFLNPNVTSISLAGTAESVKVFGTELTAFSGCFRRFIVDDALQPINTGSSDIFQVVSVGTVDSGCTGSLRCISPPCSLAPVPSTTFNAGIAAVIVFFVCLIAATVIGYFVVKKIRKRKAATTRSTPEPNIDKFNNLNHSGANLSGSTKDSGIVVGDSREMLHNCESPTSNNKKQLITPYISNPIIPPRLNSNNLRSFWNDNECAIGAAPERYDLDNASSIAPSDTDVAYHYKGYREQSFRMAPGHNEFHYAQPQPSVRSRVIKNGPTSLVSSARQSPSSVKLKSSLRSTPNSSKCDNIDKVTSSSTSEEEIRPRRKASTKSSRSKRRTASSPRKDSSSLKRSKKNRESTTTTPLSSIKDLRRFRSNPDLSDDSSSAEGDYHRPNVAVVPKSAFVDHSDSESVVCSELDLDAVRKPRRLIYPHHFDETETESEATTTGPSRSSQLPVTLAAFRGGPRSMFPVSEDESDVSAFSNNRIVNNNIMDSPLARRSNFVQNGNNVGKSLEAYV